MWTKIDNHEVVFEIKPGDIITTKPGKKEEEYIIEKILPSCIYVNPANGKREAEIFPAEELLSGSWWIRL
jgi:hypothetical protein